MEHSEYSQTMNHVSPQHISLSLQQEEGQERNFTERNSTRGNEYFRTHIMSKDLGSNQKVVPRNVYMSSTEYSGGGKYLEHRSEQQCSDRINGLVTRDTLQDDKCIMQWRESEQYRDEDTYANASSVLHSNEHVGISRTIIDSSLDNSYHEFSRSKSFLKNELSRGKLDRYLSSSDQSIQSMKSTNSSIHRFKTIDRTPTSAVMSRGWATTKPQSSYSLGKSMSFESSLHYPSSKISPLNSKKRDKQISDDNIRSIRESKEVLNDCQKVEAPIFSMYDSVLDELQKQKRYQKRFQVSSQSMMSSKSKSERRLKRFEALNKRFEEVREHESIELQFKPKIASRYQLANYHSTRPTTRATFASQEPEQNHRKAATGSFKGEYREQYIASASSRKKRKSNKKVTARKKMSVSKPRLRRLFGKGGDHEETPVKSQQHERRRNFAFLKSTPSRKKVSSATLEKKRARSKQLAELAATPDTSTFDNSNGVERDFFAMHSDSLDKHFGEDNIVSRGLNFDALENESVISGFSSVNDFDRFDDRSIYSSTSNLGSMRKSSRSRRNRVDGFSSSSKKKHQNSVDMFESTSFSGRNLENSFDAFGNGSTSQSSFSNAFHPVHMKDMLAAQNFSTAPSETGSMQMTISGVRSKRNTRSSGASVVSTSSSVKGAAARRLMRRGLSTQSQFSSNGSVVSESSRSQFSGKDEVSERSPHFSYKRGNRPPTSPTPFMPNNFHRDTNPGFTFNAFGLNENEIDDVVNTTMAEIAQNDPDMSFFMNTDNSEFNDFDNQSQVTSTTHPSTVHPNEQRSTKIGELSVSSTLTKSSSSETYHKNRSSPGKEKQSYPSQSNRNTHNSENTNGFQNRSDAFRNMKERMYSKKNQTADHLSTVETKFQTMQLPDVESDDSAHRKDSDSEDMFDTTNFVDFSGPSDEMESPFRERELQESIKSDDFGTELTTSERSSSSNERSESSPEVTHFIPRKQRETNEEITSESQRRAQSWASERRNNPIVISPLLVPKTVKSKKVTPSQRRARDWAAESPNQSKAKGLKTFDSEDGKSPYRTPTRRSAPSPERHYQTAESVSSYHSEIEDNQSHHTEDTEVKRYYKRSNPNPISKIGQQLPLPSEKVTLRRTESPIGEPDYDKFRLSAPKIQLRKVEVLEKKPTKESHNFLANVKLRKVNKAPTPEDMTLLQSHLDGESEKKKVPKAPCKTVEQPLTVEPIPSDEIEERQADARQNEEIPTKVPNRNEIKSPLSTFESNLEKQSPNKDTSGAHPIAAILNQRKSLSPHSKPDKESTENPVAALFAARSREMKVSDFSEDLHDKDSSPTNTNTTLETHEDSNVIESTENEDSTKLSTNANPVAAMFAARAKPTPKQEEAPLNKVEALFAQRSAALASTPKPSNPSPEESTSNNVNGMLLQHFAKRSSLGKSQESEIPSESNMKEVLNPTSSNKTEDFGGKPALKDDPLFAKYFKMLKMGLPLEAVKHALTRDGFDSAIMDGDHNRPAGAGSDDDEGEDGVPLKEDPKYAKYFKMLKMGLPLGAVKNAMERDGEDSTILDGDHNAPVKGKKKKEAKKQETLPKDKYRRTRVHWHTHEKVKSDSVWAMVNEDPDIEHIEIDESEFAELFQAEVGQTATIDTNSTKKANAVKVIDPKRANNGGIVLARLKITYEEMAIAIDTINDKVMNIEQVQGILEYIPTKDEKHALRKYMTTSNKDSADAFDELCECEKFMVAMMTVKHSKEKVRALLFKLQFRQCVSDLDADVSMVEKACDELKNSSRLRKLLGIVLNIGNRLNTAGPTKKGKAGAFTIDSLLKLNQAKAFDKKTTFLQYIVLIVLRHNSSLADFADDLPSVLKADKIYWDQIESDLEEVENQLENVRKIALHEVFGKRKRKGDDDDISQNSMSLEQEVEALRSTKIGIFTLQAIKIVSALRESVESTRSKFKKLLQYFGEDDNKKMNPHELFEIMSIFAKDFNTAKDAVMEKEKEKEKQNRRRANRSQSPSTRSRDSSTWSRSSKDQDSSMRSDGSLKLSSVQPHFNRKIVKQNSQPQSKDEDGSYLSNSSPIMHGIIEEQDFEQPTPKHVHVKSPDSNHGHHSRESDRPLEQIRSRIRENRKPKNTETNENILNENASHRVDVTAIREKTKAMRQQKYSKAREVLSSTSTPQVPQDNQYDQQESETPLREQTLSRRERLMRRQRDRKMY